MELKEPSAVRPRVPPTTPQQLEFEDRDGRPTSIVSVAVLSPEPPTFSVWKESLKLRNAF